MPFSGQNWLESEKKAVLKKRSSRAVTVSVDPYPCSRLESSALYICLMGVVVLFAFPDD